MCGFWVLMACHGADPLLRVYMRVPELADQPEET